MSGLVTRKHVYQVFKQYGLWTALRFIFTKERTFIAFLLKNKLLDWDI